MSWEEYKRQKQEEFGISLEPKLSIRKSVTEYSEEMPIITENREGPLFNLHKRSLPPGIDKIVEMGLTKGEALTALFGRHKSVIKNDILIYHDIIAQNATDEEMSIYYNTKEVMIREDVC